MDSGRSLQLFSNLAFRRDSPPPDYMTYSTRVVKLTGGLPLALEVIGSLLHGKPKHSWESKLEKLEKVPHKDVRESLMISYEVLDDRQKQMFLDVACFFVGFDKTTVLYFLDSDLYPRDGMEVLEHMSLLKIKENNIIWMHDQIIDFGRSITYQNGNVKLENRSRLRVDDEAYSILEEGRTEESVEAMMFFHYFFYRCRLKRKTFARTPNLKFLQVTFYYKSKEKCLSGYWRKSNKLTAPRQLRWLSLHHLYAQHRLSLNLSRCNLVILDLSMTGVTHEWDCWSQIKAATNLKVLNLSFCEELKMTPDLSAHGKLERLTLASCRCLTQIDKSIGRLKRLVFLDLSACNSLEQLPEDVGQLELLEELDLSYSGVSVLPGSLGNIKRLKVLKLDGCCSLREIPSEIGGLSYLTTLKMINYDKRYSMKINQVPKLPESLIYLHLEFDRIIEAKNEVPDLSNLVNLRELELKLYDHIEDPSLLWWIGRLSKLETLKLVAYNIRLLCAKDDDLGSLTLLKTLHLVNCFELQSLPRLPSSLLDISIKDCSAIEGPIDVSNLNHLLKLKIGHSPALSEIRGLPSSLVELDFYYCGSLNLIGDISNLKKLLEVTGFGCAITSTVGPS